MRSDEGCRSNFGAPIVPLSISQLLPIGSTSGVGIEWSKGKAWSWAAIKNPLWSYFHQSATGVKGLRRLDIKEVCFGCVLFVDIGGLVSCSDCFGLLLLSDRENHSSVLGQVFLYDSDKCWFNRQSEPLARFYGKNKTKLIVWFRP